MTKDEAIKKLIQEVKLIANCGSVEDFTVAGIRCTLRDALYRYNQMRDQPTLTGQSEESGVERARDYMLLKWGTRHKSRVETAELLADYARAQRLEVVEECTEIIGGIADKQSMSVAYDALNEAWTAVRERFKEDLL